VAASTFRPNLRLEVVRCENADDKMRRLVEFCRESPGAGIVYANSRERCEKLALFMRRQGLPAAHYHAGLEREERQQTQERFMLGHTRIIVATVAFGMGVDKPDVRLVVHFSMPESREAYAPVAGRAGGDGNPTRCVLLYAASDKANLSRWLRQEEIRLETVRDVYRALQTRLGRGSGLVSPDALERELFGEEESFQIDASLRVAISLLERVGLVSRHPDTGRDMSIEMLPPPPTARADLETILTERQRHAEKRLDKMVAYVEGAGCRHVAIARHFDQQLAPCGDACDRCLGLEEKPAPSRPDRPTADDVPDLGSVILRAVTSLPFPMGRAGLVKVLAGAVDSVVKKERCELYGSLAGIPSSALQRAVDQLVEEGLLRRDAEDEFRRLFVTPAGREALQEGQMILENTYRPKPARLSSAGDRSPARVASRKPPTTFQKLPASDAPLTEEERDRFERLRAWRRMEAQRAQVSAFVIFPNSTLEAIARADPRTLAEMERIPGMGPRRIESYGTALIEVLHAEPAEREDA
jgi:ATP-dependent DNA helicase RecQ